jgi:hypothetical protein
MELEKTKVAKSLVQSKSVSGAVGRQFIGTGVLLGAGHLAAFFLPVLGGAFFGSIFLVPILIVAGFFLAE